MAARSAPPRSLSFDYVARTRRIGVREVYRHKIAGRLDLGAPAQAADQTLHGGRGGSPEVQAWYERMLAPEPALQQAELSRSSAEASQVPTDWKRLPEPRVVALRRFLDAARRLRAPHA